MEPKMRERYFFYGMLGAAALFCLAIYWPFLTVMLVGAALAVVLRPVFLWFRETLRVRVNVLAALCTVILFLAVLAVPLIFVGTQVVAESHSFYVSLTQGGGASQLIDMASANLHKAFPGSASFDIKSRLGDIVGFFAGNLASIFTTTIQTAFSFFLIIFSLFYFLKDGDEWGHWIAEFSPLSKEHDERLLSVLSRAISGVLKGYVLIAIMQGALQGVGLWIFGVPNPALWGVVAGIASLLPGLGTSIVWIPSVIYLFATHHTILGIGLLAWAITAVAFMDNFFGPRIVGKRIELPPLATLFAILGGIALVGAAGILIGPLAVSLFYALMRIYREDF